MYNMETLKPYIGSYMASPIFLNNGKFGYFWNHYNRLYSVPTCFQTPKFGLKQAISIIDFKNKWSESKKDEELVKGPDDESTADNINKILAATTCDEVDDIVKSIKNKKSIKKTSNE